MTKRGRRRNQYSDQYDQYPPQSQQSGYYGAGKSRGEERIERLTWFLLVLIFAVIHVLLEGGAALPNWFVPLSGAVVLLGSGLYQYARRWRVSPTTWLAGALLAGLAFVNLYFNPNRSFLGICLIVFAAVILIGLVTGET
jgi:hypothetical protein